MAAADIAINIAAQFTGKNAFQKADKATQGLQKSVKGLGRSLGIALGSAAIINFGKQSVKAFAADEKAARSLSLALANTGNAFAAMDVEAFIQKLQRTTGVLDDELRPAFRTLITATGDVKKSQDALALALDISRGTGKDLSAVSTALAKGFSGQTTALSRLGAGLSKATLASGDMDLITSELQKKFAGQALEATKGFAGQMDLLTVAVGNAKEAIGKGLVDALGILAGNQGGVGGAVGVIDKMASGIAEGAKNIAFMIKQFEALKPVIIAIGALLLLYFAPVTAAVAALGFILAKGGQNLKKSQFAAGKIPGGMGNVAMTGGSNQDTQKAQATAAQKAAEKLLKTEKSRLDNLKKIAAEQQKKLALDKASAFLNQANKLFDLDRIQLAAAAMNKQTEEDKVRVRLKQELLDLEDAINEGNVEGAVRLAASVAKDAELLGKLRGDMIKLGDVPDPFAEWLNSINAILAALIAISNYVPPVTGTTGIGMGGFNAGSARMGESLGNEIAGLPANSLTNSMGFGDEHLGALGRQGAVQNISVVVNNAGSTITERDLVSAITQGIYNNQASGIPINYSTVY